MKFGTLTGRLVLVTSDGAIDVGTGSGGRLPADPQAAFERWDDVLAWARSPHADAVPFAYSELEAPVARPRQVFAIGMNYASHAAESGLPEPEFPTTFTKFPSCIDVPDNLVVLPSEHVDWEVELVAVVGRPAHQVDEADAWSHVAGLTVGQDLTERAVQWRPPTPQFSLAKSYPGFGPIGPLVVTPDEFDDPDDLEITCALNGIEVQRARTSDMIFPVPTLIAYLSSIVPLLAGDLVFTGTPAGVGAARTPPRFLTPADELMSTIEGIGTIHTRFDGRTKKT